MKMNFKKLLRDGAVEWLTAKSAPSSQLGPSSPEYGTYGAGYHNQDSFIDVMI